MTHATNESDRLLESHEVEGLLQQGATLLDVRTPAEYETVHIPGSYNIPLDQLPHHRVELGKTLRTPLILVCRSGARATQAARLLEEVHPGQCHILRGGMSAWELAGKRTKRGKQRWSMERQVRGVAGTLVVLSALGGLFLWKPLLLFALAVGGGLTYSALTDTCGMALLLSKLPYNRSVSCDVRDVVRQLASSEASQ